MKNRFLLLSLLCLCCLFRAQAQGPPVPFTRRALDGGVYDYSRAKRSPARVYYGEEADARFSERLMRDECLLNSGIFGQYITRDDGSVEFFREEEAIEYCPELNYVMKTGGHGYVSAYDLETLEEIYVNPSTYVYSPSGRYRFGSFDSDGVRYFLEAKEGNGYVRYWIGYRSDSPSYTMGGLHLSESMEGVYWVDDDTIHYLSERRRAREDGTDLPYWIGYSMTFAPAEPAEQNE